MKIKTRPTNAGSCCCPVAHLPMAEFVSKGVPA